jgi:hypothetical protein
LVIPSVRINDVPIPLHNQNKIRTDVFMQFLKDKFAVRLAAIDLGISYKNFTAKIKVFLALVHCFFSLIRLYGINAN